MVYANFPTSCDTESSVYRLFKFSVIVIVVVVCVAAGLANNDEYITP